MDAAEKESMKPQDMGCKPRGVRQMWSQQEFSQLPLVVTKTFCFVWFGFFCFGSFVFFEAGTENILKACTCFFLPPFLFSLKSCRGFCLLLRNICLVLKGNER